jgi:competence protein ComEC
MLLYALSFLFGIEVFSLKQSFSISFIEGFVLLILIFCVIYFCRLRVFIISFLIGFFWMAFYSFWVLSNNVQPQFLNKNIVISGTIADLPQSNEFRTKFLFEVDKPFKAKIKLSWYQKKSAKKTQLKAGDKWQFLVKLKQNNGFQNPAGFDYEKWLFSQKINATGYVKKSPKNKFLKSQVSLNSWRGNIRRSLIKVTQNLDYGGVLLALATGDRSQIKPNNWLLFTQTGTSHLSVVSGLHIGLIAGFFFLLFKWLWSRCEKWCLKIPNQIFGAFFAIFAALLYALIAGFSIPTQRAFIMVLMFFSHFIFRRYETNWTIYAYALILVLIINPLNILTVGFWLSFVMVFAILYGLHLTKNKPWYQKILWIQVIISLAGLPLLIIFFQTLTLTSPLANIIAVPFVTLLVMPLLLVAIVIYFLGFQSPFLFDLANQLLSYLMYFLNYLQQLDFNIIHIAQVENPFILFLSTIAILLLVGPKGLYLKRFSLFLLLPLFLLHNPKIAYGHFKVVLLDSGQGLASVLKTKNHILIFDTGFNSRTGFNIADSAITPYLYSQNLQKIDKVIISHLDNDHAGGLKPLLENFKVNEIITSQPQAITNSKRCYQGLNWSWDGVGFEFVHPTKDTKFKGNNASCVLKVSNKNHSILIIADIEKQAERELLNHKKLKSDVVFMPHHGSLTSSTTQFIDKVSPSFALISTGFHNRFKHPNNEVVNRYQQRNIKVLDTQCVGAIEIIFKEKIKLLQYRLTNQRYWTRVCQS